MLRCPRCSSPDLIPNGHAGSWRCQGCAQVFEVAPLSAPEPVAPPRPDPYPAPAKVPPYPQTDSEKLDLALHRNAIRHAIEIGMTDRGEILSALRGDGRFCLGVAARVLDEEGIG